MALEDYRRKRHFSRTPEPVGDEAGEPRGGRFVVQKHGARNLHYDLRLELDRVLKSWAIPKGPSLDPREKRLAVHVEDHPLEYLEFEGVIPHGEYGAGTVLVWDIGTWEPLGDADRDYTQGKLKFRLNGHKLQGSWMLVRLAARGAEVERNWLLIKERDQAARSHDEQDILQEYADSALTGRTLEQVAKDADRIWTQAAAPRDPRSAKDMATVQDKSRHKKSHPRKPARRPAAPPSPSRPSPVASSASKKRTRPVFDSSQYPKARRAPFPARVRPCLPTATDSPPSGNDWVHEIKYDGYRMLCHIAEGKVKFISRNGNDWTSKLPSLAKAMKKVPAETAILDGEAVMMAADGTTSFQALQNRIGAGQDSAIQYYVFDLPYCHGYDLTRLPLDQRKHLLADLLRDPPAGDRIRLSEHIVGQGPLVLRQACKLGAEGIVSKRQDRRYTQGRTENWLKTKCLQSHEFVVGGYTDSTASRLGFGAILVGYLDSQKRLRYAGRVGTGFTDQTLVHLRQRFDKLASPDSPFQDLDRREAGRDVHWVRPELVVDIEFGGWTGDGLVRFGSYRGLRDDLSPGDIDQPAGVARAGNNPPHAALGEERMLPAALSQLRLTHPDRVVYPETGVTKLGVATYYARIASWMLPHIAGRPLSLLRCPKGCQEPCFFQKRAPTGLHPSVERARLPSSEGEKLFLVVHDLAGLLSLVQFSVLEFHVWGARHDLPLKPDRMIFDLDPDPAVPWNQVVSGARRLRELLDTLGLVSFVKTTGGKGLHVVVPVRRRYPWSEVKQFSARVAALLVGQSPGRFTSNPSKAARRGKIYIDFLRNARGATAIAPYSTRARPNASVAIPIGWDELDVLPAADAYTLQNVVRRMENITEDPWSDMIPLQQSLSKSAL